jgi:hypothetical protein
VEVCCILFYFTFVVTVFIRKFLFIRVITPIAASIIISKGSSGCSFNKRAAGNSEAIYNFADTTQNVVYEDRASSGDLTAPLYTPTAAVVFTLHLYGCNSHSHTATLCLSRVSIKAGIVECHACRILNP